MHVEMNNNGDTGTGDAPGQHFPIHRRTARPVAVIDIGASSMRLVIAQVDVNGKVEVLERLERAVRLGHDTFTTGRLGREAINAAVAILRDYRKLLDTYGAELIRVVATSAAREAANSEVFVDRVATAVGIEIDLIDPAEESRLAVSAVREVIGGAADFGRDHILLIDVGGGSTLITELKNGTIVNSQSYALGSVRLQENLGTASQTPARSAALLRHGVTNIAAGIRRTIPMHEIQVVVAIGKEARTAARTIGQVVPSADRVFTVARKAFDDLVASCISQRPEKLAKRFGIALPDAERLVPGLLIYQELLRSTSVDRMIVCNTSMRDGLLLALAHRVTGHDEPEPIDSIVQSAWSVARRYQVDEKHAEYVAGLALKLFDALQQEHGLSARHRVLLHVAAILHDCGRFVSNRAHHKHTYYIVANSEVFGLSRAEMAMVAHIARYHRRSPPRRTHIEYVALSAADRVIVNKLASIIRVANALDSAHTQPVRECTFQRQAAQFIISVDGAVDLTMERRVLTQDSDLFEDTYGLQVRIEEAETGQFGPPRAPVMDA